MKRVICSLLAVALVMCWIPFLGDAAECEREIIQFEDGSYAVIEVVAYGTRAAKSVDGSKQYTYCDSDGTVRWKAVLNGTFTYTGSSSKFKLLSYYLQFRVVHDFKECKQEW